MEQTGKMQIKLLREEIMTGINTQWHAKEGELERCWLLIFKMFISCWCVHNNACQLGKIFITSKTVWLSFGAAVGCVGNTQNPSEGCLGWTLRDSKEPSVKCRRMFLSRTVFSLPPAQRYKGPSLPGTLSCPVPLTSILATSFPQRKSLSYLQNTVYGSLAIV